MVGLKFEDEYGRKWEIVKIVEGEAFVTTESLTGWLCESDTELIKKGKGLGRVTPSWIGSK